MTVFCSALSGGQHSIAPFPVPPLDAGNTAQVATDLAAALNLDPVLSAAGISASANGTMIKVSHTVSAVTVSPSATVSTTATLGGGGNLAQVVNANLTEIRKLDAQSQPLIVGTIERRPGGGFFSVDMQFIGENRTTKFYQSDDPQLTKNFYLCDVFGKIAKQIDTAAILTPQYSAPSSPTYIPTGDLTERLKDRASPFASPFSPPGALTPLSTSTSTTTNSDEHLSTGSPFSTSTDTSDEHLIKQSPFESSSSTPGLDALNKQLEKQNH